MEILRLELAVKKAWSRDTSSDPENWSPQNPAWSQFDVTSLVVNDYLGGSIIHFGVRSTDGTTYNHTCNKVEGEVVDFTKVQFPEGSVFTRSNNNDQFIKARGFDSVRAYMLSIPEFLNIEKRYLLLKEAVKTHI